MSRWMVAAKKADFYGLAEKFHISPITARLLRNRDAATEEEIGRYLHGTLTDLHDPFLLTDMDRATELLRSKISAGARIRIIGDYDVDGICAAYILLSGLRAFGARVDAVLPHRITDGYGLNPELVEKAHEAGIDTIVTCDNGIAAAEQVAYAKRLGMTVIVTDHHEVPYEELRDDAGGARGTAESDGAAGAAAQAGEAAAAQDVEGRAVGRRELLPPADAVIDPKRAESAAYPYREICGAVVAYKLVQALTERRDRDAAAKDTRTGKQTAARRPDMDTLLEFAALATVCDVMPLKDENRIIVREGLKRMHASGNQGLRALIQVNGLEEKKLSAYHLGFVIGPCLNATGRLDSAGRALQLLESATREEAVKIAGDVKALNDSRKDMTKRGVEAAVRGISDVSALPPVLVIYLPGLHESIAGIVAGKVRERFCRPTIILTDAEEGVKGSGRSIEGYDMFRELSACRDLFTKFGGHKAAAGLSMRAADIDTLRSRLNAACTLTEAELTDVTHIDMVLPFRYITTDLVKEMALLEPFGNGNGRPLFAQRDVRLLRGRRMGKDGSFGRYEVTDESGLRFEMVYFGDPTPWHAFLSEKFGQGAADALYAGGGAEQMRINIVYYPDINVWQGRETLQLVMRDYA